MSLTNLEVLKVICPACGQQVEALASDSRVKGYCAISKRSVDFPIKKQRATETRVEVSAGLVMRREGRDSKGRFIKGNVPVNKGRSRPNDNLLL